MIGLAPLACRKGNPTIFEVDFQDRSYLGGYIIDQLN